MVKKKSVPMGGFKCVVDAMRKQVEKENQDSARTGESGTTPEKQAAARQNSH